MKKSEKIRKKINNYLFDHQILRALLSHTQGLIIAAVAALIFAFGFSVFITPAIVDGVEGLRIATGGVSGVSQTIALVLKVCGAPTWMTNNDIISIAYFVVNIPIVTFAFFKIGKRFAIHTAVNVGLSSLFIYLFSHPEFGFTHVIE